MKEIETLIEYIKKKNIPKHTLIKKYSKVNQLYDILMNDPEQNITNALSIIYDQKHSVSSKQKLKEKFKKVLYTSIFTSTTSLSSSYYTNIIIQTHKNWATITHIRLTGNARLASYLAINTLKTAVKYEILDVIIPLATFVATNFQKKGGTKKDFQKYLNILNDNLKYQKQQQMIDLWYAEIAFLYKSSKSTNKLIITNKLIEYNSEFLALQKHNNYLKFNILGYIMLSTQYILQREYPKAISNAKKALKFLKSKSIAPESNNTFFYSDLIISYIMLKSYTKASEIIKNNLENSSGQTNYANTLSYQFTNDIIAKNYNLLPQICLEAIKLKIVKSNRFKNELWQIRLAYLYFLNVIGKITTENPKITKFRVRKMINDVPIFTKDKKGMHNSIKILEIILLLITNNYDRLIDKHESLRVYAITYLKGKESYRNRLFFKMIGIMIMKSNFHPVRAQQLTKSTFEKLKQTSYDFTQIEQEIIPYDILWEYIILLLQIQRDNKNKK